MKNSRHPQVGDPVMWQGRKYVLKNILRGGKCTLMGTVNKLPEVKNVDLNEVLAIVRNNYGSADGDLVYMKGSEVLERRFNAYQVKGKVKGRMVNQKVATESYGKVRRMFGSPGVKIKTAAVGIDEDFLVL